MKLRLDAADKLTRLSVECVHETKTLLADFEKKLNANEVKAEVKDEPTSPVKKAKRLTKTRV